MTTRKRTASSSGGERRSGKRTAGKPRGGRQALPKWLETAWLKNFFMLGSDIFIIGDTEGRILYINSAVERILGRRIEDYVGRRFAEYTHPDDLPPTMAYHQAVVAGRELPPAIVRIKAESGRMVPLEFLFMPLCMRGKIRYVMGVARDATLRMETENALKKSEALYKSIANSAAEAIFCLDSSGRIVLWNKAAKAIFGYSAEEVLGKPVTMLMEEDRAQVHRAGFEDLVSSGRLETLALARELPGRRKDGAIFPAECSFNAWKVRDEVYVSCILRDVSERKRSQQELEKSEERYRFLFEEMLACNVILAQDGTILDLNRSFLEKLGYSKEEIVGRKAFELVDPVDRQTAMTRLDRTSSGQELEHGNDFTIKDRRGETHTVYFLPGRIMVKEKGGENAILVTGIDVTGQRTAEAALRASEDKYRSLVEHSPFGILTAAMDGTITFVNKALLEILGSPSEEATLKINLLEFPPLRVSGASDAFMRCIREGEPQFLEVPYRTAWGRDTFLRASAVPLKDAGGGTRGIQLIVEDITERKRIEQTIRKSEERYRAFVEHSKEGIWCYECDPPVPLDLPEEEQLELFFKNARLVECNEAVVKLYGVENSQDVLGWRLDQFIRRDDRQFIDALIGIARSGYKPTYFETVEDIGGAGPRTFAREVFPIIEDNRLKRAWGVMRDITESKTAELALKESEQRYRALAESSPDFIFIIGRDGRLEYVNANCAEEFSTTPEKMVGNPISVFFPGPEEGRMARNLRNVFISAKPMYVENKNVFPRRELWLNTWLIPLKGEDGKVTSVLGVSRDLTARKLAEDDLREKTTELWAIFQALPDLYFRFSSDGSITDYKAGRTADLYLPPESFLGRNFRDVLPNHVIQLHDKAIEKARKTGTAVSVQYSLPMAGSVQHYEARLMPIFENQYISFVRNITEQKNAEKALIDRERYRALYDRSLDCIFVLDLDGRFLDANPTMQETVGFDMDELLGMDFISMLPEEQRDAARASMQEVVQTGSQKTFMIHRLRNKDGGTVHLETKASAVLRDGKVSAVQAVARNISQRVLAQEALKESEIRLKELSAKLRNIIDSSPDAIIVTDIDGIVIECNRSAVMLHGVESPENLIGINSMELLAPHERERGRMEFSRITSRNETRRGEFVFVNSTGREYPVEISASAVTDANDAPVGMVAVVHDITDRILMQEKLIQNEKMAAVGTLVAGLSHELNNPIGVMLGYAQSILRRAPENDPSIHALRAIEREARRCGNLVKTLLDFSRKSTTARKRMNVGALLARLVESAASKAAGAGVTLELGGESQQASIHIAPTEIESALLNIINNAIDASPGEGVVRISAEKTVHDKNPCVVIAVSDQGNGIPADVLPHIFEPFYTTKPVGRGTGLGLSLARKIVETHGGDIAIESAPGKGTIARVWLPLAQDGAVN